MSEPTLYSDIIKRPVCAKCTFWKKASEVLGYCRRMDSVRFPDPGIRVTNSDFPQLLTRHDFGCVQFQEL